jgi:hypothetical protein
MPMSSMATPRTDSPDSRVLPPAPDLLLRAWNMVAPEFLALTEGDRIRLLKALAAIAGMRVRVEPEETQP